MGAWREPQSSPWRSPHRETLDYFACPIPNIVWTIPPNSGAHFWEEGYSQGCGSCEGSAVVRFRGSGVAGVPVHGGAGVTAHRWLKVAFIPSNLVKATFSHHRTTSEATTVTPTTSAPPQTPLSPTRRNTPYSQP